MKRNQIEGHGIYVRNPCLKKGFSLLEMMICLLISAILLGTLCTVWINLQRIAVQLVVSMENRTNLNLAPLLLAQRIKVAGMNLFEDRQGNLTIKNEEIGIKADIDGDQGVPDGDNNDSFENIWIQAARDELRIKSGQGTYQPFLRGIRKAKWIRNGDSGLRIELASPPDPLDREEGRRFDTFLFLWNAHPNLLPEVLP